MRTEFALYSWFRAIWAFILALLLSLVVHQPVMAFASGEEDAAMIDFVYIESRTLELNDEQNVVVSLSDPSQKLISANLTYGRVDEARKSSVGASEIRNNAVAFSLSFSSLTDEGNYYLDTLTFIIEKDGIRSTHTVDLDKPNRPRNTFTVVRSLSQFEESPAVGFTAYTVDANGEISQLDDLSEAPISALSRRSGPGSKVVVALDAGHGGSDPGAMSYGLIEKNITLAIAKYCEGELAQYPGIEVIMTRSDDRYVGLEERVQIAADAGASLFISFHVNAGGGTGAEVWIPNDSSWYYDAHEVGDDLGSRILEKLQAFGLANRGNKFSDYTINGGKYYPDGSPADALSVIRNSRLAGIPGLLIEHGFIDRASDAELLSSDYYLRQWGIGDATAIAEYLGETKAGYRIEGLSLSPSGSQLLGKEVELDALVAGDVDGLLYKFTWEKDNWNSWEVIQADSPDSSSTWIPVEAGSYTIYCDITDHYGNVQTITEDYWIRPWAVSSVTASPESVELGGSVEVSASVSGDGGGLQYKYSVVDLQTGEWSLIKGPSQSASVSWEPPRAGSYEVTVDVIDDAGYLSRSVRVEATEEWALESFEVAPAAPSAGRPVSLSIGASGTTSGLTYKFVWERGGWADWGVIQGPGPESEAEWVPGAPGDYTLFANVIDSRGVATEFSRRVVVSGFSVS